MSFQKRIELAQRKVRETELAAEDYLRSHEFNQERYQQLAAEAKAARHELMHELTTLRPEATPEETLPPGRK
jgi:hypothetical protein